MPALSIPASWRRLLGDKAGGTTLLVALALPVLAGALGIGVDVGSWYVEKRKLQQVADAAALGGARVKAADQINAVIVAVATNDAGRNGYVASASSTLTVNSPPASGAFAGKDGAVEAIVTKRLSLMFAGYFMGSSARTLSARAVGMVKTMIDPDIHKSVCLMSLIGSGDKAIFMNGSGSIVALNCSIAAHSTHARSLYLNGSGLISGYTGLLKGDHFANGSGSITFIQPAATYLPEGVPDPYAGLGQPDLTGGCTKTNFTVSGNVTIQPGRYCGGILNPGSNNLFLEPGTYYIDRGDVKNSGSGNITCPTCTGNLGVTLVFTANSAGNIGGLFSNGSGRVVLPAPGPGSGEPYVGVAVYQDRRASPTVAEYGVYLTGSSGDQVSGVIYAPSRSVLVNGTSTVQAIGKACMSIIALKIVLNGSGSIAAHDCGAMGSVLPKPRTVAAVIVE
ncbi:MAG: hypothetical protein KF889_18370 [Alphaproteobacteria bacterium]|nr:hypothetical protein [Alphaproteobacteria bacterium]MCW5743967.1 hypothetical protein [Alphaproteobacteria bacterium]